MDNIVHMMESRVMNQGIDLTDVEELNLNFEVPNEQLEAAAAMLESKPINVTLSFCSGLDSCPS